MFLDSGIYTSRPLLLGYVKHAAYGHAAWQLLQRIPDDGADDHLPVVETLTDRELTVLRYLPTMM